MALMLIIVLGGGFATKALWLPLVFDYLPRSDRGVSDKAQADRISELERELKGLRESGAAIDDLEKQRGRINESLSKLMSRLSKVEGKLDEVGKMTDVTAPPSDVTGMTEFINRLSERVTELDKDGESLDAVLQRLAELEQGLAKRQTATTTAPPDAQTATQALVLAIGNLRESLKSDGAFFDALSVLQRLGGDHPDVKRAAEVLAPFAAEGIATIETLRMDFVAVASAISKAMQAADDGLVKNTINRIKSLITVRRIEGDGPPQADAGNVPGGAERSLEQGKLGKAIDTLGALQGAALTAAEPWLKKARARLDANAIMGSLNKLAISLLAPAPDKAGQ